MSSCLLTQSANIRSGAARSANRHALGVPLEGSEAQAIRVISLGAPAASSANAICLAQAVAGAGNATIAGALASGGVATIPTPRALQTVSTDAGDTTQTVLVSGFDVYGQAMSELIALNGTTVVKGKKAFAQVTTVHVSAALTGNLTLGTCEKLGLPYRPVLGGFLRGRLGEDTADAGTYVVPERSASTTTTNDVRGTYAPAGSLNGSNVYTVAIAVQNGPLDSDGFGIPQA